ncbi:MAG: LamG domain-containing protein [Candidatus Hydrogenedentes bacterium]|nr:LamG domain-containing protein [Candidatus Hydrogenedentota bacterium]
MKNAFIKIACVLILAFQCITYAEEGLLLHYAFTDGTGELLHDSSGAGLDGTLKGGASWVEGLPFGAISFNGVDAVVEGPSGLTIGGAGTLEVWCHPRVFGGGLISWHYEHPATPKPISLYFDVYTYNRLIASMSEWKNDPITGNNPYTQWNAALTTVIEGHDQPADMLNRWSHFAMTFNDQEIRLYRNGKLQASKPIFFVPDTKHVPLRIGQGYLQGIPFFDGMIAEVRIYSRALSENEIKTHVNGKADIFQPNLPYTFSFIPRLHVAEDTLMIEADLSGLPAQKATIEAKLLSGSTELQSNKQAISESKLLSLPIGELAVGEYDIVFTVRDENGEELVSSTCRWRMPKLAGSGVRALNNLVAELMNATNLPADAEQTVSFNNPRNGFVFASCEATLGDNDSVRIDIGGAPEGAAIAMTSQSASPGETMCFLPEGEGTLQIRCEGKPVIQRIIVRSIPELMFCGYPTGGGKVEGYGAYDFDFLREDVLPNISGIVAIGGERSLQLQRWTDEVKDKWNTFTLWKNMGRRWYQEYGIPSARSSYDWKNDPLTPEQTIEWCVQSDGFTEPSFNGILADEFALGADAPTDTYPYRDPRYRTAPYTEAIHRIAAMPEHNGKKMYMWCGGLDRAESRSREFVEAVIASGGMLATEEYLAERPTENAGFEVLHGELRTKLDRATKSFPGLIENLILVPSIMSAPPESENVDPHVDYKVWMDMQMHYMATAPEMFGLGGIMWYKISYADEEAVRWMGRLFRHYAIDGETAPLSPAYHYKYNPGIIQNADFDDGLTGWTIRESEPGAITVGANNRLAYHQGRRMLHTGSSFLLLRRCEAGPNTASQVIKNLRARELYSVKMLAADHQAMQQGMDWTRAPIATHARVTIVGAELLPDRSFISSVGSERGPQMFDYHRLVFRANNRTATLKISDWASDEAPVGAIGQELMFNFIEVQPYFD